MLYHIEHLIHQIQSLKQCKHFRFLLIQLRIERKRSFSSKGTPHGIWLAIIIDLGAIAGLTSVALVSLLGQSRVFYSMAHDGLLPSIFAKVHPRTKTPWISTIIIGTETKDIVIVIFPFSVQVLSVQSLRPFFHWVFSVK